MSDDLVKNERDAVNALMHGIQNYTQRISEAIHGAQRDLVAQHRKAEQVAQQRHHELARAGRELQSAEAALAQCRENCGGLQQRVQAIQRALNDARKSYDRAQRGVQGIAAAQSEFAKAAQEANEKIKDQGSVASSALADLDARLSQLGVGGRGHKVAGAMVGIATLAELINPLKDAGTAMNAVGLHNSIGDTSMMQMVERHDEQATDYVIEKSPHEGGS